MGCWAIPDTAKKAAKLRAAAKKLDKIQREIWNIYGDDELMDNIDMVRSMILEAAKNWKRLKKLNEEEK